MRFSGGRRDSERGGVSGAVLLTGATGLLGMETLVRLIDREQEEIIVIVRAEDDAGLRRRLQSLSARLYESPGVLADRVHAVRGDLTAAGIGLGREDRRRIVGSVDRIIHCAASISFEMPLEGARAINVEGLARVIALAREIARDGSLRRIVHVSTAYAGGRCSGSFGEADLDVGEDFRNTYERSKYEGERLLHTAADLPAVIARPSIVVGHHASGWTPTFNVIYLPMRAVERGLLRELPALPDSIVDFVPVDYVADGLIALLEDGGARGTYHLVAGQGALTAAELVDLHSLVSGQDPVRLIAPASEEDSGALGTYAHYFDVRCSFDDARAREALVRAGVEKPAPTEYLGRLIAYARTTRWGKRPISREAAMSLVAAA